MKPPTPTATERSSLGYAFAALFNFVFLLCVNAHEVWRPWLGGVVTEAFSQVLWALNLGLVLQIFGDLILSVFSPRPLRRFMELLYSVTGVIDTNLGRHMNPVARFFFGLFGPLALKSVPQGAATEVFVATHPSVRDTSGKYFADCNVVAPRKDAEDPALAMRLWEVSEKIVSELPGATAAGKPG